MARSDEEEQAAARQGGPDAGDPAARRQAAELAAVLGAVADGVLVFDAAGRITRSNPAADAILGYTPAERALPLAERLRSLDATWLTEDGRPVDPEATPALRAARAGETVRDVVFRLRTAAGERFVSVTAAPFSLDGERAGAVVSLSEITARREAEAALRRSEGRLRATFEDAAVGIVEDEEGRLVAANPRLEALLGYGPGELVGRTFEELTAPEDRAQTIRLNAQVREGALRLCDYEKRYLRRDGTRVWVHVTVSAVRDEAGRFQRAIATVEDISERKRTEAALREAERRFRAAIDRLPSGLIVADLATRELHWNREALAIHGYTAEDDRQRVVEALIDDHELRTLAGAPVPVDDWPLPRLLRGQGFRDYELRVRNARLGWERVFSYAGEVIPAHDGVPALGLLAIQDVSERKRAEEALRRSEEEARAQAVQLEAILDSVADGLVVYDREGRALRSSAAADEILGVPAAERRGPVRERVEQQYEILDETGRRPAPDEMIAVRAALHGETVRGAVLQVRLRGGAGPGRWLRMNAVPLFLDGRHMGAVLSMTDVTDRKLAEEALREANERLRESDRRKTEFLGVLSHELRNPLAPITNGVHLLERVPADGPQAARARQVIARQAQHLARLVDDLLDVTRIARGKVRLRRELVDLTDLLRRTCEDHRALFADAGLALHLDLGGEPLRADVDPTRIAQVIGNLLANARKFTAAGGAVTVELRRRGAQAVARVRDTGIGIAPERLGHLFQPFVQEDRSLARTHGGLGLGLALSRGLVELHGGSVVARSDGPGRGAELEVALPLAAGAVEAATPAPAPVPAKARLRILVIEDNEDAARTLADVLELEGHQVARAADGRAGIALARAERPDVVVCDIGLPDLDGYAVARALRRDPALRAVRLVALSGYAGPEDRERSRAAGFEAHVAKAAPLEQLTAWLR